MPLVGMLLREFRASEPRASVGARSAPSPGGCDSLIELFVPVVFKRRLGYAYFCRKRGEVV